jgi:phosphoglycolate phosphatase-like HAD superfamily hydrolase
VDLLVLWDVDYTLVGADGLGTRLYEVVFREMFGRELAEVAPKAGRTDRAIVGDTLALAGVARTEVDAFLVALARVAADGAVPGLVRPLPGAAEAIAALAAAGVRQSVLTGNVRPLAEEKLRRAGLGADLNLDAGAYGDVHEVRAELVTAARRAARRVYGLDFPGEATVLIGDTPLDVAAALATGARAVAVATGSYPATDLVAAGAHVILPDLTDTARVVAAITGVLLIPLPHTCRAAGRARARATAPAAAAKHSRHLGGGLAGLPLDLRPAIPQRLLPVRGGGVVPGLVPPLVLGLMREPSVELDHHAVGFVNPVPPPPTAISPGERHLPGRFGQPVRKLHIPVVAELQHRMVPARRGRDELLQVVTPPQPVSRGHRLAQPGLIGKLSRYRAGDPAAYVIEGLRGLREVEHRLFDSRPGRIGALFQRLHRPVRPVQADALPR